MAIMSEQDTGLSRFRRFGERYFAMQVESGLTLENQWLKTRTCEQHSTLCS